MNSLIVPDLGTCAYNMEAGFNSPPPPPPPQQQQSQQHQPTVDELMQASQLEDAPPSQGDGATTSGIREHALDRMYPLNDRNATSNRTGKCVRVWWDGIRATCRVRLAAVSATAKNARHSPEARRVLVRMIVCNLPLIAAAMIACLLLTCLLCCAFLVIGHAVTSTYLGIYAQSTGATPKSGPTPARGAPESPVDDESLLTGLSPAARDELAKIDGHLATKCRLGTGDDVGSFIYDMRVFRTASVVSNFNAVDHAALVLAHRRHPRPGTTPQTGVLTSEFTDFKGVTYILEDEAALCALASQQKRERHLFRKLKLSSVAAYKRRKALKQRGAAVSGSTDETL